MIIRPACLLSFDFIIKHIMDIKVNSIPRSFSKILLTELKDKIVPTFKYEDKPELK